MSCETQLRTPLNCDLQRLYSVYSLGQPYDLTGWGAALNVYASLGGSSILTVVSSSATANGSFISMVNAPIGGIGLLVKKADLATLPLGNPTGTPAVLYYDLVLTDPNGLNTRFAVGTFIIDPSGSGWLSEGDDSVDLNIGQSCIQINLYAGTPYLDFEGITAQQLGTLISPYINPSVFSSATLLTLAQALISSGAATEAGFTLS
jgi:hypothetical protein